MTTEGVVFKMKTTSIEANDCIPIETCSLHFTTVVEEYCIGFHMVCYHNGCEGIALWKNQSYIILSFSQIKN